MIIGAIKEQEPEETRISLTPDVVKKLTTNGHQIVIEKDYGTHLGFRDDAYASAGAKIFATSDKIYKSSEIITQILPPYIKNKQDIPNCHLLIADFTNTTTSFSPINILRLERVPRTSAAQPIDILSSQSLPRGYMAALYALWHTKRIAPQMMTAATSTKAMQALVIGAGTTGLQTAATLKKAGCHITITDINPKTAEVAVSIGADFKLQSSKQDLSKLITGKNIIINTAPMTMPIITTQEMIKLPPFTVFADTTTQSTPTNIPPHIYFYSNPHFERFAPLTASDLWAHNILNLINIILPTPNRLDLSPDYIQTMLNHQNKE